MADILAFQKGLVSRLAKVLSAAEERLQELGTDVNRFKTTIKALEQRMLSSSMKVTAHIDNYKAHIENDMALKQAHTQALIDLEARSKVEERNRQSFEQRLETLQKRISAIPGIGSSENAVGSTKLRTKQKCFEDNAVGSTKLSFENNDDITAKPNAKRKYHFENDNSLNGTFRMTLRSQTRRQALH